MGKPFPDFKKINIETQDYYKQVLALDLALSRKKKELESLLKKNSKFA